MTFYILRRKKTQKQQKNPQQNQQNPTKWQTETPKLNIHQVKEMRWPNWELKVAKGQDAALEECNLLFPVAGSHLISSVKMKLHF